MPFDPNKLAEAKKKKIPLLDRSEQLAKEGLTQIASAVPSVEPTGNVVRDVALNTPKVVAETLAETAPQFVNKEALLTAGAAKGLQLAKPVMKLVGSGMANQAEQLSGAVPGSIKAAYNDATLMFAKGKKAISKIYEEAKGVAGGIRPELKEVADRKRFVLKARKLAQSGALFPEEALEGRKELDKLKNTVTSNFFYETRALFDDVAKKVFAGADDAHRRAIMGESLRNLSPQNKYGGASAFKLALQQMLGKAGFLLSPAVQGSVATTAGLVGRHAVAPLVNNPLTAGAGATVISALDGAYKRKKKKGERK